MSNEKLSGCLTFTKLQPTGTTSERTAAAWSTDKHKVGKDLKMRRAAKLYFISKNMLSQIRLASGENVGGGGEGGKQSDQSPW